MAWARARTMFRHVTISLDTQFSNEFSSWSDNCYASELANRYAFSGAWKDEESWTEGWGAGETTSTESRGWSAGTSISIKGSKTGRMATGT